MTEVRPILVAIAALGVAGMLAGCASSKSAPSSQASSGSSWGLAGKPQAAAPVPVPPAAMADPPPEVPPGPPSKSYAYRGGRDPLTGQASTIEGAAAPLEVDANGDVVQPPLPGAKGSAKRPPAKTAARPAPVGAGGSIVVAKGDTLYGLALRHRVPVSALMSANGLKGANIVPGQRLVIPR